MYNSDMNRYDYSASDTHHLFETSGSTMPPPYHDPLFSSNFMDQTKPFYFDQYSTNSPNDYQSLQASACPYQDHMSSWQHSEPPVPSNSYHAPIPHPQSTYSNTDIDNSDLINQLRNLQIVVENQNKSLTYY